MAADEEKKQETGEPVVNMVAVNLADITGEIDEEEEPPEEAEAELEVEEEEEKAEEAKQPAAKGSGSATDLFDDIFAEEAEENDKLKSFGDLEHLTMVEVASEVEAVLEELRIRQGGHE